MSIEAVAGTPGLWRAPDWQPQTRGLYTVVIGVSRYRHMGGGESPAAETYGFEQLISSATTAASVFDWLVRRYQREGLPLVWCYLLLAPQPAEQQTVDAITTHYAEPTYTNISAAIDAWTTALPTSVPACTQSRTLFFFSGHGVQARFDPILLPSDYLRPSPRALQEGVNARELREWMESHCVGEQFALLDACRNEFEPLAKKTNSTLGLFPENDPARPTPITAATLAGTSPNRVAYQLPGQPLTCFGTALLEGLEGLAAHSGSSDIEFASLVEYVGPRVNALLSEVNNRLDQPVRPWIDGGQPPLVVTELPPDTPMRTATPSSPQSPDTDPRFTTASATENAAHTLSALRDSFTDAHRFMGHERATPVLQSSLRVFALDDGTDLSSTTRVVRSRRNDDSSRVELLLDMRKPNSGAIIAIRPEHPRQPGLFAVVPGSEPPGRWPELRFRTHLTLDTTTPMLVQKLDASLDTVEFPWGEELSEALHLANLGMLRRAAEIVVRHSKHLVIDPQFVPHLATIAALLVLVRANAVETVFYFPVAAWRTMNEAPSMSDSTVLWVWSQRMPDLLTTSA